MERDFGAFTGKLHGGQDAEIEARSNVAVQFLSRLPLLDIENRMHHLITGFVNGAVRTSGLCASLTFDRPEDLEDGLSFAGRRVHFDKAKYHVMNRLT